MTEKSEKLFAIHHHITEPDHYDFMFETDETLFTWRVLLNDFHLFLEGKKVSCRRIQDHRKEYLTYEGPVSCDRGFVDLFDSGKVGLISSEPYLIEYRIFGNQLKGILRLSGDIDGECIISFEVVD